MKKNLELGMAVFLLAGIFFLGKQGAISESEVAAVTAEVNKSPLVVIDAGHGGEDPGKVGVNEVLEKDINLLIARKLGEYLESQGIQVELLREEDAGLNDADASNKRVQDLQRRCRRIHELEPVCTVSIHQNSYPESSVKGAQVFYYTHSEEGKILAQYIQTELVRQLDPGNHRQAKGNTTYYLLKKTDVPLAIVECGFLSNPQEAELLTQGDYQTQVAKAVGDGILEYLTEKKA